MIKHYLKIVWRNLMRNKVYSFINIAGLNLGLACAMLIILYIKDELSYDRFHANGPRIYRIVCSFLNPDRSKAGMTGITGYFQGPRFTAGIPEIRSFVRIQDGYANIKNGGDIRSQGFLYVDSSFFSAFSFPLLQGNAQTALLDPHSIVLSEEAAKKHFGTTNALGKIMFLKVTDQFEPYSVTAIAKNCPQNSSIKFDILLPLRESKEEEQNSMNWFSGFLNSFVVIAPHADVKTIEGKMEKLYHEDAKEAIKMAEEKYAVKTRATYLLQPFTDMHLSKDLPAYNGLSDASNPTFSYILSGIALFILLIACINFVNLTIARSIKRAKEIGIRKVVGGERNQLIFQFMGESFALCFLAFALAIVVVQAVLPVFNNLSNKALAISYLFDTKLVIGYLFLFLVTVLLAGFYPALVLSNYDPVQTLYNRYNISGKNYLQKSLVVLQFALASFLIIATVTIFYQFDFLTNAKLGYDDSNLVLVHKGNMNLDKARFLRQELIKNPNIIDMAPKNSGFGGRVAKVNGDSIMQFAYETVDESYIPLLKIPIVKGRNFSRDFPSDSTHAVLVNESFVKQAGWKNPIGQELNFWNDENKRYSVVGVVKDHHYESLTQKINPQVFTMNAGNNYGLVFIKIKPHSETASLQYIGKVFKSFFPLDPYNFKFKDQENLKYYEAEAKWKQILLFGAILTIFISCIGLFGLSVLAAEKRTKEIGIRKVLGASVGTIVSVLSIGFLKLIFISLLIAIPGAWIVANKWLEDFPYHIHLGWSLFAGVALLVILIAISTISFQAIKAAYANPVKSLRTVG